MLFGIFPASACNCAYVKVTSGTVPGAICARIRLDDSANPPNGSWGIVKVQPQSLIAVGEGRALTIPQLPLGGLGESSFVGVGRALTIPQLPLGDSARALHPYPGAHGSRY